MNHPLPPSLSRLASLNPVAVDDELGRTQDAQAVLKQILASEPEAAAPRRAPRIPGRRLIIVLAAMMLAGGAAFAAADPFGWRSANPDTALYRSNPAQHVRPPTILDVRCRRVSTNDFQCGPRLHGRPYLLIDHIEASPKANVFSRPAIQRSVAQSLASGRISRATARRVLADLARVSDSFLTQLGGRNGNGYGSYEGGPDPTHSGIQLVPPPGVPSFLVCQPAGALLGCQDLNGDAKAPIGSGVYQVQKTADWRPAPPRQRNPQPPGFRSLTHADLRLMRDLVTFLTTSTTTTSGSAAKTR
jgi:hypothetical protein